MTTKHFKALADLIRQHQAIAECHFERFSAQQLETLAIFCKAMNPRFDKSRWYEYLMGTPEPNRTMVPKKKGKHECKSK